MTESGRGVSLKPCSEPKLLFSSNSNLEIIEKTEPESILQSESLSSRFCPGVPLPLLQNLVEDELEDLRKTSLNENIYLGNRLQTINLDEDNYALFFPSGNYGDCLGSTVLKYEENSFNIVQKYNKNDKNKNKNNNNKNKNNKNNGKNNDKNLNKYNYNYKNDRNNNNDNNNNNNKENTENTEKKTNDFSISETLGRRIHQVSVRKCNNNNLSENENDSKNIFVSARTHYDIHLFLTKLSEKKMKMEVKNYAKFSFTSPICHFAWNPWVEEKFCLTFQNGEVKIFDFQALENEKKKMGFSKKSLGFSHITEAVKSNFWRKKFGKHFSFEEMKHFYAAEFLKNPFCALVSNSDSIFLSDFRMKYDIKNNLISSIDHVFNGLELFKNYNSVFFENQKFCALATSPDLNSNYFATSTTDLVLLFDIRKGAFPIFQWQHMMQYEPPNFLTMTSNEFSDQIIFAANSGSGEIWSFPFQENSNSNSNPNSNSNSNSNLSCFHHCHSLPPQTLLGNDPFSSNTAFKWKKKSQIQNFQLPKLQTHNEEEKNIGTLNKGRLRSLQNATCPVSYRFSSQSSIAGISFLERRKGEKGGKGENGEKGEKRLRLSQEGKKFDFFFPVVQMNGRGKMFFQNFMFNNGKKKRNRKVMDKILDVEEKERRNLKFNHVNYVINECLQRRPEYISIPSLLNYVRFGTFLYNKNKKILENELKIQENKFQSHLISQIPICLKYILKNQDGPLSILEIAQKVLLECLPKSTRSETHNLCTDLANAIPKAKNSHIYNFCKDKMRFILPHPVSSTLSFPDEFENIVRAVKGRGRQLEKGSEAGGKEEGEEGEEGEKRNAHKRRKEGRGEEASARKKRRMEEEEEGNAEMERNRKRGEEDGENDDDYNEDNDEDDVYLKRLSKRKPLSFSLQNYVSRMSVTPKDRVVMREEEEEGGGGGGEETEYGKKVLLKRKNYEYFLHLCATTICKRMEEMNETRNVVGYQRRTDIFVNSFENEDGNENDAEKKRNVYSLRVRNCYGVFQEDWRHNDVVETKKKNGFQHEGMEGRRRRGSEKKEDFDVDFRLSFSNQVIQMSKKKKNEELELCIDKRVREEAIDANITSNLIQMLGENWEDPFRSHKLQ